MAEKNTEENVQAEAAQTESAQDEKPLDKMTTKELKELALEIPDISGVHGMNKEELISAIKEFRGIVEEKKEKKINTRDLKKKIADLKEEKKKIMETGDKKQIDIYRRKISRLKKLTRRAA